MPIIMTDKPLKKRPATDFYPTPYLCAVAAARLCTKESVERVLDPGAGDGVFGKAVKEVYGNYPYIVGIELDNKPNNGAYNEWRNGDFLYLPNTEEKYDLIIGNPPYSHAEAFARKALDLVNMDGEIILMFKLEWLASARRAKGIFTTDPPNIVHVLSQRPSFTGDGKTNAMEYAYFHWIRDGWGKPETVVRWMHNWR
jgi:hypothetical protein